MKYKRILVTSALPYANGPLHLGHIAGAYLPADIYVRFQRLKGRNVIYICGSDEHGVPITVTAEKEGISPQDVVDRYHSINKESFQKLRISFDHYSRTSIPLHHKTAQEFFNILYKKGDLVVKYDKQFYSESSNQFLPDRYVEGKCPYCNYESARGDQCDSCGKWLKAGELIDPRSKIDGSRPVLKETKHWYLPMGRFAEKWKRWFEKNKEWKENVKNYCMGWYREGLEDRPITRDLQWGVPVPLEDAKDKVLYVWFDAPVGYISATKEWAQKIGDPDRWREYWCDSQTKLVHFIGKDNIVFHAILFPMILMEVGGYILPDAIPANEYLTIEGRKISTSQNYAIWVKDYLRVFPPDPLRYTLAANSPETKDTDFSWHQFQRRNNDELADTLGNFINRTFTFIHKYCDGRVPLVVEKKEIDLRLIDKVSSTKEAMEECFENYRVREAVYNLMDLARFANKYFNDSAPWETRKSDFARCQTTLNICLQIVKDLAILMSPIMPDSSERLISMLRLEDEVKWDDIGRKDLPTGHIIGRPEILFKKIDDDLIEREIEKLKNISKERETQKIEIEDFVRVGLKAARVISAEKVKGTDQLLKVVVDLGSEKRTIIVGVAEDYEPEQIIGRCVIVTSNLKPATIRGIESNGMILAAKNVKGGYSLLTTDGDVAPGTDIE